MIKMKCYQPYNVFVLSSYISWRHTMDNSILYSVCYYFSLASDHNFFLSAMHSIFFPQAFDTIISNIDDVFFSKLLLLFVVILCSRIFTLHLVKIDQHTPHFLGIFATIRESTTKALPALILFSFLPMTAF